MKEELNLQKQKNLQLRSEIIALKKKAAYE